MQQNPVYQQVNIEDSYGLIVKYNILPWQCNPRPYKMDILNIQPINQDKVANKSICIM